MRDRSRARRSARPSRADAIASRPLRGRLLRRSGMTLIEIMIVIILLAMVASGITYSFNALNRTYLRSACMHITAASRYAYNRAIARNTTVRLVFNLHDGTMAFEESEIPIALARIGD